MRSVSKIRRALVCATYFFLIIWGVSIVTSQIRKYLLFRTTFVKQSGNAEPHFPKLLICSSSLHSRKKIKEKYPFLTKLALDEFYGRSVNMNARWSHHHEVDFDFTKIPLESSLNWTMLDSIDIRKFISSTTPEYFIETCNIELFDCRMFWRQVQTLHGSCISVSPPWFQLIKLSQLNIEGALQRHYFLQNGFNQSRDDYKDSFTQ